MNESQKQTLEEAKQKYRDAAGDLVLAVMKMFPLGTVIECTIGRSTIRGEVVSSGGFWWHAPDSLRIENLKTGRTRRITATHEGYNIKIINP